MLKLKRGKKPRRKTVGIQKREKKGSEKGSYCERPYRSHNTRVNGSKNM
jgi:hypothetical protein